MTFAHRSLRSLAFASLLALCCVAGSARAARALPPEVEASLKAARVPADSMVAVVREVGAHTARIDWQGAQPVNPASLTKLLTTQAALEMLGPTWTWSTPVWLQGTVQNGVLDGSVVIKGSGDPRLVVERVWLMLRRIQQAGVREIRGDIVLDRSAFVVPEQNPADFDGEALRPYNVGADALLLNFKSMTVTFRPDAARHVALTSADVALAGVRVDAAVPLSAGACDDWRGALKLDVSDPARVQFRGTYPAACGERAWPIASAEPARYNARLLEGLWREMGGALTGRVRDGMAPQTPPTFEMVSPPLAEIIRDINKFSNNTMAQQLFLTLALAQRGQGTPDAARALLTQWARERFGRDADGLVLDNGSGLSRDTRLSARLLADLLQSAFASGTMPELMSSLPLSGLDGTLKRSKAPAGRAHLKTGSLNDVTGIAGYVLADNGKRYVIVAIVNYPKNSDPRLVNGIRAALDALVRFVAMGEAP